MTKQDKTRQLSIELHARRAVVAVDEADAAGFDDLQRAAVLVHCGLVET